MTAVRFHRFVQGLAFCGLLLTSPVAQSADPFQLVVMDPLSEPLSCDCVKGYAQRKYELLGKYLSEQLGVPVNVTWHESLAEAVKETGGQFDLVIGKHSVVLYDAKELKRKVQPIARLTGKTGEVVQQGLVVVRNQDKATKLSDLQGYQLFLGPEEAEEKSSAPRALLKGSGVTIAGNCKTFGACSEAAVALMKMPEDAKAAAVISSYAEPLLEGCGSIQKGDLRVLGKTKDVPFITAFVPSETSKSRRKQLDEALQLVATKPKLLVGLETLVGFEPWASEKEAKRAKSLEAVEGGTKGLKKKALK